MPSCDPIRGDAILFPLVGQFGMSSRYQIVLRRQPPSAARSPDSARRASLRYLPIFYSSKSSIHPLRHAHKNTTNPPRLPRAVEPYNPRTLHHQPYPAAQLYLSRSETRPATTVLGQVDLEFVFFFAYSTPYFFYFFLCLFACHGPGCQAYRGTTSGSQVPVDLFPSWIWRT